MNAKKSDPTVKQEIESVLKKGPVDKRIPGCYCWECRHSILVEARYGRKKWFCRHMDVPIDGLPNEYFGCILGEVRDEETHPLTPEERKKATRQEMMSLEAKLGIAIEALNKIRQGLFRIKHGEGTGLTCCYCNRNFGLHKSSCPVQIAEEAKCQIDMEEGRQDTHRATATEEIQRIRDASLTYPGAQLIVAVKALNTIKNGLYEGDALICCYCSMPNQRHAPSCPVQIADNAKKEIDEAGSILEEMMGDG